MDIKSEWQANKGVILYLWDAIDYSDLEQLVRMHFLGTFRQLEITVQEHVSCSEESMHIMLQKAFLEPFILAQKKKKCTMDALPALSFFQLELTSGGKWAILFQI